MVKDKVLVVGGYGHVGQVICRELGEEFPGKIIAAGRNYEKAKRFTQTTNETVLPLEFDVFVNHDKNKVLEEVFAVVMCMDQEDTQFIETCIKKGVHYIDITASYSFLSKIESLHNLAKDSGATAILSAGISPGLTNLLVQYSKLHFDVLDRVDIYVMIGIGEEHGKAAIEWMVDNMNTVFNVVEKGVLKQVNSFEDGKKIHFHGNLGYRTAYRFNFAEQHTLPKTLNIKSVSHRICFDSKFITKSIALLKKIGFFNLLKLRSFRSIIIKIFEKVNCGSDVFVAKVDALGKKDGKTTNFECSVMGNNQTRITGKVGALITQFIYTQKYPSGVYHIEQIASSIDILEQLSEDIHFYSD